MKKLEEDLENQQKKKQAHTLEKDCVSVAKSVQDATEKAARMRSQAEAKVVEKVTEQDNLEKTHAATTKKLKEEYEKRLQLEQQAYKIAKEK